MKAKKPVLIPVRRCDGGVPHYTESPAWSEYLVRVAREQLAAGYFAYAANTQRPNDEAWWRQAYERDVRDNDFEWVEPFTFVDEFEIEASYRGRSAAGVKLVSSTNGGSSFMMLTDLLVMLRSTTVSNGIVSGTFTYKKRGANYLMVFVSADVKHGILEE